MGIPITEEKTVTLTAKKICMTRLRVMKIASVATLELATRLLKKSQKKIAGIQVQLIQFLAIFSVIFSAVASPVQGWLHLRFSSRACNATKFEKIASPARAKNRSCRGGLKCNLVVLKYSYKNY